MNETQHVEALAAAAPDVSLNGEPIGLGVFVDQHGVPISPWRAGEDPAEDHCPAGCGGILTVTGTQCRETGITPVRCYRCGFVDF